MYMRELVCTIKYKPRVDPIMDEFMAYETTRSRSIACHVSHEGIWRIDRLTGPPESLDMIDYIYSEHDRCLDCVTGVHAHSTTEHEILGADTNSRTIYTFRETRADCLSMPCLISKHVQKGVLCESVRRVDTEEWRLLLRDDTRINDLYEDLEANLRVGLSIIFGQLSNPSYWTDKSVSITELPFEQRTAMEAAVSYGYYETPREISLSDLAKKLDVPQSTLQHQLQQAETWIVSQFAHNSSLGDITSALRKQDRRIISA